MLTARIEGPEPVVLPNAGGGTPRLSTWGGFYATYRDVRGRAIRYRRAGGSGWTLDPDGSQDWTIHEYWEWYQSAQRMAAMPNVAYYLTNIPLKDVDLRAWRAANAEVDALCMGGALDLMRYIRLWNEDAPVPPMKALGYLAPPWLIGTYPHFDGAGSQVSVHTYAFGPGWQLVHVYPELSAFQEQLFLETCGLKDRSVLPHSWATTLDCSLECWDTVLQARLAVQGIVPVATVRLMAGQTIVLPARRAHAFKKCVENVAETWRTDGLMFSVAGDASFVGATQACFVRELSCLLLAERTAAVAKEGAYSMCELALLSLVREGPLLRDDVVAAEHLKGVGYFFKCFIEEQCLWARKAKEVKSLEAASEILLERACCQCKRSLANVMLVQEGGSQVWCGNCCPARASLVAQTRFYTLAELEEMFANLK